jgi:pimeloyl-ACP methyl ester carboxylesterase
MLRFDPDAGERTASPEDLSFGEKAVVLINGVTIPKPRVTSTPLDWGLEFESLEFQNARGQQLLAWRIPAKEQNGGPIVLLFHGYAACKEDLLPMAMEFREVGCETVLLDFYGSGESSGSSTSFGYFEAEDIVSLVDQIESGDRRLIGYGISMGGAAMMRACAVLDVNLDGLIVESVFPNFRETIGQRFKAMGLPATPAADLLMFWGCVDLGFSGREHNPADYARKISVPTLVLTGAHDQRVPETSVRKMVSNFAGEASLHVFDVGHRPFVNTHPETWKSLISEFLNTTPDQ